MIGSAISPAHGAKHSQALTLTRRRAFVCVCVCVQRCLRDVRDLMSQPAIKKIGYYEYFPTMSLVNNSDEALDRYCP
jgi:hypothetical protein